MSLKNRLAKLEKGCTTSTLHDLDIIRAKDSETLIEAVTRVAKERGLAFEQIGAASVMWVDDHRLQRKEEYRHPTVRSWDDVTKLIGHMSHEEWLTEIERIKKTERESA